MDFLFTSESISIGHPDRLADNISNAILTDLLKHDKTAHCGIELLLAKDAVILGGEVSSTHRCDYEGIARNVILETGYTGPDTGFDGYKVRIENHINSQSPDIAQGVNLGEGVIGAGDQGIIFGYASNETETFYPLAAQIANELILAYQEYLKSFYATRGSSSVRFPFLRPDAKSQVTVNYTKHCIDTVVFSASHNPEVSIEDVRRTLKDKVFAKVVEKYADWFTEDTKYLINPTGRFVICGPIGDAGLTGRKLAVDSYGGYSRLGGGNTNGKDPSKVDMSAARAARHAAKNLVAAGVADAITIQLSYAIGVPSPVSIDVIAEGASVPSEKIAEVLADVYDFSPAAIIKNLHLADTDYTKVCYFNQFCGEPSEHNGIYEFPWEELNLVDVFKKAFGFAEDTVKENKQDDFEPLPEDEAFIDNNDDFSAVDDEEGSMPQATEPEKRRRGRPKQS